MLRLCLRGVVTAILLVCVCIASTRQGRPLVDAEAPERPLLYNTTTYGVLELDFTIYVEMVGVRSCNTTTVADGVVKGEHYAPIFDSCGVEGQLTVTSSSLVNASIPLVRLNLTWADSYTSDAHTYDCSILWNPTESVTSPSCDVAYSHGENFYSATFQLDTWGGYVLPTVALGFNVSVVISDNEGIQCRGSSTIDPFLSSKPLGIGGTQEAAELGDCDSGFLFYTYYFNTKDLNRYAVQPTWCQSVVLPNTSQNCFFSLAQETPGGPFRMGLDSAGLSCSDYVVWESSTYQWTFEVLEISGPPP